MAQSKHFWRGLFFITLITALCGALVLPVVSNPAHAAPVYQIAPACNLLLAEWTFDPTPTSTSAPAPSTANVTATATQNGVGGVGYQTAGAHSGNAWSGTSWSQNSTPSSYFEFDVSTVGYMDILVSFWHSRSNTGPQSVSFQYSTDGSTFTEISSAVVGTSVQQTSIDLTSITALDNNPNAKFRIYGINASGSGGNLRIDDVRFTGCQPPVIIDSTTPNPTNSGTTVTWHAVTNGNFEVRLGSTSCTDGTVVGSGAYTTSPNTVSSVIDTNNLVEGVNSIRVCLTDASAFTDFAVSSVTKDTVGPNVTVNQANGQIDPAFAPPINFSVVFSEAIDPASFVPSDITHTGTATGITWTIVDSGDHINFSLRATAITGAGTLIPSIAAGAVNDLAGNSNTVSTSTDNTVTFFIDNAAPTVTVNQAAGQLDPATVVPISFAVVFSEPIVASEFTAADITQTGTASGITWAITNPSADQKTFVLQATAVTGAGTLIPTITAGKVPDLAGNNNTASTSTDNSVTYTVIVTLSHVVISEFRTRGPGGAEDEFVEIYNPTSNPVDISGWVLSASNSSGTVQNRVTIPAATLLRSGQYYLIAHNSYVTPSGGVSPNLRYGTSISDDGGIALIGTNTVIIDEVGMDEDSFYQEGDHLAPLSGTTNRSYERKEGGASDSCVDTNENSNDFQDSNSNTLHNYSSPLSLCGTPRTAPSATTTLITGDSPDPSNINGNVTVSVRVTGGTTTPTGPVSITGANTNCTLTLNASGTGSCTVKFTSTGSKTLTASYLGDNTHASSSDTEPHQVGTTSGVRPSPTPQPTLPPPPPLIGINEFVPRPGHDWNNDGVINVGDEYIELINHGVIDVDLSGYSLDDEVNIGSEPYRLPSFVLKPGQRKVFYGSETGLLLSDGGDGVRLLKPNGQLGDAYNYRVVRFPDQSYCRLPDNGGLDDWNQNCFPTPGLQNSLSGSTVNPPTSGDAESLCPIADTLPNDFVFAECLPFGNNIFNSAYWDRNGWYGERNLPQSPGKWNVFVD